jgi:GTPase SAR1 family protein
MAIFNLSINKVYPKRHNCRLFLHSIRACIIGKSGCGKTNLMFNLLLGKFNNNDYLDYDNLYIFSKSLHQPMHQLLIKGLEAGLTKAQILECILKQRHKVEKVGDPQIQVHCFEDADDVSDLADIDPNLKTLFIFDDIMLEKQDKVESYYTHDRHNNIDCFYISQNYAKLPKKTIRENANLFILFPQSKSNLDYFYEEHCMDLKRKDFMDLCRQAWAERFGFVTIDLSRELGWYRKMLDCFLEF